MDLNGTQTKAGKYNQLFDVFLTHNGPKQGKCYLY